ncbi:MAG: hypothetical protein WEG36_16575 [Gemmatimonadota bacterium]
MDPKIPRTPWALALVASAFLTACGDSTGPEGDITASAAESVALFLADADGTGAFLMVADGLNGPHTLDRTRPCPAGGSHSVTGSRTRTLDEETRIVSTSWTTVQTHDACTFTRRRGGEDVTVVIDGSVTAEGSATHQLPETPGDGRQVLSYQNTRTGAVTTTVGDRTRTCEINMTESYDPATDTFTVVGTICGREVNVTREHRFRPQHD